MGILSDTLIADLADAEAIAGNDGIYSGKYNIASAKGMNAEMFDTLLYILRGKKHRVKPLTASKLVYQLDDDGPWVYQLKDELIQLMAELDPASVRKVALDILKLDETFQAYAAIGLAVPPTGYLNDFRKQCQTATTHNQTILLRISL
jgi:hypothetical protein